MGLRLYNTLSGKLEEFQPLEESVVRMYSCGPTVYDYGHIGNFRTFVAVDVLRRVLKRRYKLIHVMNITDVDDKIIQRAGPTTQQVRDYADGFDTAFREDMRTLRIQDPEKVPRATDFILQMADFISLLELKQHAYRTEDGSFYFRINTFPQYGKLSKKNLTRNIVGARVDMDEYEKDDARDFALWKAPKTNEASWLTPIGLGRPGWHIECSTMARALLGDEIDIHCGGEDLIFPHHENEIAQSESLTGETFARYWFHVKHLLVDGKKMSKSLGNFYTVRDIVTKSGGRATPLRYFFVSSHYRTQLNFTFTGLEAAGSAVERVQTLARELENLLDFKEGLTDMVVTHSENAIQDLENALLNDLNTPEASAALMDFVRKVNIQKEEFGLRRDDAKLILATLQRFDEIFDILPIHVVSSFQMNVESLQEVRRSFSFPMDIELRSKQDSPAEKLTPEQQELLTQRDNAKRDRNFTLADSIRAQLANQGIILEDKKDGSTRWKKAKPK